MRETSTKTMRKILIVDPDLESIRPLSKLLRQQGHQIFYAPDGSRALQLAVLRYPELILFAEETTLVNVRTFIQILRSNPRTEAIPLLLTVGDRSASNPDNARIRERALKKPLQLSEVLERIEKIFRRADAAKRLQGETTEIEGTLAQLPVSDLLQVLALNKKSGRLNIEGLGQEGTLFLGDGRPLNARIGGIEGEKALFRLLTWTEGTFAFASGTATSAVRISKTMEEVLLEGLHQADECARLWPALPPRHAEIHLAPEVELPSEQHPVTAQIVELLKEPHTLGQLIDTSPATDLEALSALTSLIQKGVVRVAEPSTGEGPPPLLVLSEVHALRARLYRGRPGAPNLAVAKIFLCGKAHEAYQALLTNLPDLVPAAPKPAAIQSQFGTLGSLAVSEALSVHFCILPAAGAAAPLWRPFSSGAVGALVLDPVDPYLGLARYFGFDLRLPLVVMGAPVPAMLAHAPAGAAAVGDWRAALRTLLVQTLHPAVPFEPAAALF